MSNIFANLKANMAYLGARQKLIAEDLANLNTPKFQAKDLEPYNFKQALRNAGAIRPMTTDSNHIALKISESNSGNNFKILVDRKGEKSLNGNNVSLENELIKMSETSSDYQLATDLYRKMINMLKKAIS